MVKGGFSSREYNQYFKVDFDEDYFPPHNAKVKSHLKFIELDINWSQACCLLLTVCRRYVWELENLPDSGIGLYYS